MATILTSSWFNYVLVFSNWNTRMKTLCSNFNISHSLFFTSQHMDPSQYEIDVEPNYVRITVKGKVFQLRLNAEVRCDAARAERSPATGKLIVTMPRVKKLMGLPQNYGECNQETDSNEKTKAKGPPKVERLEVRQSDWNDGLDFSRICRKRGEAEEATGERDCGSPPPLEDIDAETEQSIL